MSDTPQTDAKAWKESVRNLNAVVDSELVHADFARELERENARMLNAARGCHDYGGGYRDAKEAEIFHHGIQTVINVLEAAQRSADDPQVNALIRSARQQT